MKAILFFAEAPKKINITGYSGVGNSKDALDNILTLAYAGGGIIAIVVLVVAGLLFVTARGDANQIKRSKDAIRGAVIGLIVILVAFTVTQVIIGGVQQ